MNDIEIRITPKTSNNKIDFKEFFEYRDLTELFVKRNFSLIYKQTILGPLWLLINPLVTSVLFTFIFGGIAAISTDGVPQFLFYMAGNTMWAFFNHAFVGTSNIFLANSLLFKKIYFPRFTVPVSQILTSTINFLVQFAMLMIFWLYYYFTGANLSLNISILLLPLLIVQCATVAVSVGLISSSLTTKYRDLTFVVTFGVQMWMYATPIVYPISATGGLMKQVLLLNPLTPVIHNFKVILLGNDELLLGAWVFSAVVTGVMLAIGLKLFANAEKSFVDSI